METKKKNYIQLIIKENELIEYVSPQTGLKNSFLIKNNIIKLLKSNIYYIPMNENYNSDNYYVIKQKSINADKFQILTVRDRFAIILPLITTILSDNEIIGEII